MLFALGVFLPLVAWSIEMGSHICRDHFFDPLPTPLHSLLWLTIPVSNLWLWLSLKYEVPRRGLGILCGVAQGIAILYTLLFLPMTLLSLFCIVIGLGFCSLSPMLALPVCFSGFRAASEESRPAGRWFGVLLAFVLLALAELPVAATFAGIQLARNPGQQARGLDWLRKYGDEQVFLKACYQKLQWNRSPVGMLICMGSPPPTDEVRQLFYRATGTPFNVFPAPPGTPIFGDDGMVWERDEDQGSESVGGRVYQLGLKESTLAARIDPTGSTALWNWDLTFSNGPQGDREARCQVQLPPGGVLSGALLWVNGKPRQALIASRGKARTAYEQAVKVEKRDPLLVTTSGPDRLLVQCFPVPSNGTIHIQLTITSPLLRDETEKSLVKAPAILERNFSINCKRKLALTGPPTGLPTEVNGRALSSPGLGGRVEHSLGSEVCCADPLQGFTLAQWSVPPVAPGPLWVVVDGSASMQAYRQSIAAALRKFRSPRPVGVLLAGDEVVTLLPMGPAEPARLEEAARSLEAAPLVGGQNDVAALVMAKESRVVWVHDGQALQVDTSALLSRADSIVALACSAAPNRVIDQLGCREAVRSGPLSDDLVRTMEIVSGQRPDWLQLKLIRVAAKPQQLFTPVADLSRLWALGECARLGLSDDALKLAVAYGLVTPISGAVVLESEEQEKRMGLRPSDGSDIPVVPEPTTWLLLGVLGVLVMGRRRLRR